MSVKEGGGGAPAIDSMYITWVEVKGVALQWTLHKCTCTPIL